MTDPLRPEVLAPKSSDRARAIALCASCGASLVVALIASATLRPAARTLDPKPVSSELLFVFRAGGATFVRLADLEAAQVPDHGNLRFANDHDGAVAIGAVKVADVPPRYRAYRNKRLRVDGDCTARVVGLSVVARLAGDTDHAALEQETWTAAR
jgi:hypothetical protein